MDNHEVERKEDEIMVVSKSRKQIAVILIIALAVLLFMTLQTDNVNAASKTKKMTVYRECLKSGNTVYCSNERHIFKVDLNTEQVTKLTGGVCYPNMMKLKGSYLYYRDSYQGFDLKGYCGYLYRINVKTMEKKKLAAACDYAIKGNKIYYNADRLKGSTVKKYNKVMKLNGESKKSTKFRAKMTIKDSNAAGYYVYDDVDWDDFDADGDYYLATPNGFIFLEHLEYPVV